MRVQKSGGATRRSSRLSHVSRHACLRPYNSPGARCVDAAKGDKASIFHLAGDETLLLGFLIRLTCQRRFYLPGIQQVALASHPVTS